MFTNDTDIFVTRVTNPTDKPFCHRGLPRYPTIPASGSVDVKGVYTKAFRDEWLNKALLAGMQFKVFCTLQCEHVKDLGSLPQAPAAAPRAVDPDALPKADPAIVTPLASPAEPEVEIQTFKTAAAESEKRGEALPAGVVRHDDLMKAEDARTVSDSQIFQRMKDRPVVEKVDTSMPEEKLTQPADDYYSQSRSEQTQEKQGGKKGKKRSWMNGL